MAFSHHNNDGGEEIRKLFQSQTEAMKLFKQQQDGTAKRTYPEGRLGANDEGALAFQIYGDKDRQLVGINFGKDVREIAMNPQQAIELAQSLIRFARQTSAVPLRIVLH